MKVVLAGGGTAGHIEPALNLADELRRRHPEVEIVALGTSRGLETTLVPARGYDLELIEATALPRKISGDLFSLPVRLRKAIAQCKEVLKGADVVVGFGGYVSLPAYLAARGTVPIVIHEANARAGLANRVGTRFAQATAVTVAGSLPNGILTGIPLRDAIVQLNRAEKRDQAREFFGIPTDATVVLIFGGSQGAARINQVAFEALEAGCFSDVYVIHAVGKKNEIPVRLPSNYQAHHYLDRMDLAYSAADFVISRSGAVTVAELTAVGLPACFVPLPIGNGEQALNARAVAQAGGAVLISDAQFNVGYIREHLIPVWSDKAKLQHMAQVSAEFGHRGAGGALADLVEKVMREHS